jgi:amidase
MSTLDEQLAGLDGVGLSSLIRKGELSAPELLELTIERIERVNPLLNGVAEPLYQAAREQAQALPAKPSSPLHGVPTLIKDLFMPVQGALMQNGSLLCQGHQAPLEGTLVARMRQAGMVIAGTTTSPEFGTSYSTESRLLGATRNPWNPQHIAGGSSGGAAALVAARALPIAHANDGGGSIRVPASCCGIFGLKPTRGRTPIGPLVGEGWAGMGINHAVSVSVRDSAALLDCVAGSDAGAPYAAPHQAAPFLDAVAQPPRALRIAVVDEAAPWPSDPDCQAAVRHAAALCESLGHRVMPVRLPLDSRLFYQQVFTIIGAQTRNLVDMLAKYSGQPLREELLEPRTRIILREKGRVSGAEYAAAVDWIHAFGRQMAGFFADFDVLLTPTLAQPPLLLGALDVEEDVSLEALIERSHSFSPFTAMFNASGQPAMSVPLYWNAAGLPIGVQFATPFGDEATLFALAGQLEQAQPWAGRLPAVSASAA